MRVRLKPQTMYAVQWKGWPHKILGVKQHPTYPQLGEINGQEVYKGDWIVAYPGGERKRFDDFTFKEKFEAI